MKRILLAAALLCAPLASPAQTSGVPNTMSYQGRVADGSGALVGATTPTNRTVIFRVWSHATNTDAGSRLYSERQTVTIANGEFSVLIGAGNSVDGETNALAFPAVFDGQLRYLGVTVFEAGGAAAPEISPRQQIVTNAFAFRAKVAESVIGTATGGNIFQSNGNVGIGTNTPIAPLTVFSGGNDAKIFLQTTASGTGASDGLGLVQSNAGYLFQYENLPLHLGTNATTRLTVAANGNVGIGITTPTALLSLGNSLGNTKLALWDDGTGTHYGLGVQANQLRLQIPGSGDRFSFFAGTGATPTEVMTVRGNGFVGIGNTAPIAPLQLYTATNNTKILLQHAGTGTTDTSGLGLIESNKGYLWQYSNLPLLIGTNSQTRMTFTADGKVAIGGGENPGALLSLGGATANTKLALWDNEAGAMYGLGMGGNQMRFHTNSAVDRFSFLSDAAGTSEMFTIKSSGNVGVGISAPTAQFHVHSTGADSRVLFTTAASGTSGTTDGLAVGMHLSYGFVWQYENLPLVLATNSTERVLIGADGRIGFNVSAADNYGYVFKNLSGKTNIMAINNSADNTKFLFTDAGAAIAINGGGPWSGPSDARLKRDIADVTGALEKLLSLRSVTFHFKDQERYARGLQTGFIAQEVQHVFPDWVSTAPDGSLAVGARGFEALAVQALRELRAEKDTALAERDRTIAAQDARIRDLESQAKSADARMAAFERKLGALSLAAVTANSPR